MTREEAINKIKEWDFPDDDDKKEVLKALIPELKEDEDERLRKELTEFLKRASGGFLDTSTQCKTFGKWLAWLEKQGNKEEPQAYETESDEVITNSEGEEHEVVIDPRFHKGEWIASEESVWQVDEVRTENYLLISGDEGILFAEEIAKIDSEFHLWTIKDAKDGDVLASVDDDPFIYKGCLDPNHPDSPVAYCGIDSKGDFCVGGKKFNHWWTDVKVYPATKEQQDLLFQKMKEAGYEWDAKKKVLGEIEKGYIDEEEQKFRLRNWVVTNYGKVNQIVAVNEDGDGFTLDDGTYFSGSWKDNYHLWTIKDAKDGDVLITRKKQPFIFEKYNEDNDYVCAYCGITDLVKDNSFYINDEDNKFWTLACSCDDDVYPATKEQREFLFQKMKEAGYEWDAKKKVLNKIVQKVIKEEVKEVLSDNASQNEENTTTVRLQRIIDFLWKNRKGDTDTIFQQEQDIAWLKSLKQRLR